MSCPDPELTKAERRYREHVDQMRAPWGDDALIVLAEYDRRAEQVTGLRGVLDLEEAAHEATAREVARLEAENAELRADLTEAQVHIRDLNEYLSGWRPTW